MLRLAQTAVCVIDDTWRSNPRIENLRSGDNWSNRVHIQVTSRCLLQAYSVVQAVFSLSSNFHPSSRHTHIHARNHTYIYTHIFRNLCFAENSNFNYEYLRDSVLFLSFFLPPTHGSLFLFSHTHVYVDEREIISAIRSLSILPWRVFRRESTDSRNPALSARVKSYRTIDHRDIKDNGFENSSRTILRSLLNSWSR